MLQPRSDCEAVTRSILTTHGSTHSVHSKMVIMVNCQLSIRIPGTVFFTSIIV